MNLRYSPISSTDTYHLRQKVLRPHQSLDEMAYPLDNIEGSYHVGAFLDGSIVGVASIYPESQDGKINQGQWRLRGMAVDDQHRGLGIGQELVKKCIRYANTNRAIRIWCNARSSAIGFYLGIGFFQTGDEFEIEGIGPHYIAYIDC